MSFPQHPQQPQWQPQQPGLPGQGPPPPQGAVPAPPHGAPMPPYQGAPGVPGSPYPGQPGVPGGPGGPVGPGHFGGPVPPGGGGARRNKWMIPAAAGLAVALMGGTVWATVSLVGFGGPQPEEVLPGNSVAFAKIDLAISGAQAVDLLTFVERMPEELSEDLDNPDGDTEGLFADMFEEAFPDADKGDIEEWIGQSAGIALWPAQGDAQVEDGSGVAMGIALAVEDEQLADEAFRNISAEYGDVFHETMNDFVVFSSSEAALTDLHTQTEAHGPLADAEVFAEDIGSVPDGSIMAGWADFGALMQIEGVADELADDLATQTGTVSGRATASVRVDGDYLEARMDAFAFEMDQADLSWLAESPGQSVAAMEDLPDNTVMALGANGLDQALIDAYRNDEIPFFTSSGQKQEFEREFNSMGISMPEGFSDLLGSSTAFGITQISMDDFFGYGSGGDVSFEYRAIGGSQEALGDFVEYVSASDPYSTPPGVSSEGDAAVVALGSSSTGRLGDDPVFQQTMQEMDAAVIAGFFDLRQVLTDADVQAPDQWGALGMAMSVTDEGQRSSIELRWAPSNGS